MQEEMIRVTTALPKSMYDKLECRANAEHSNRCVMTRQAVALFLSTESSKVKRILNSLDQHKK